MYETKKVDEPEDTKEGLVEQEDAKEGIVGGTGESRGDVALLGREEGAIARGDEVDVGRGTTPINGRLGHDLVRGLDQRGGEGGEDHGGTKELQRRGGWGGRSREGAGLEAPGRNQGGVAEPIAGGGGCERRERAAGSGGGEAARERSGTHSAWREPGLDG